MKDNRAQLIGRYRDTKVEAHLHDYYNHPFYATLYSKPKRKWVNKAKLLSELISLKPGETVLDVGCAGKLLQPAIKACGGKYFSMDIASHFQPDYLCDATALIDFPKEKFDWIILADILEHLPGPDKVLRAANNAGKKLIVVTPHLYRLEAFGRFWPIVKEDRHLHKQSCMAWRKQLTASGWRIKRSIGYFFIPSFCWNLNHKHIKAFDVWLRRNRLLQKADSFIQYKAMKFTWMKYFAQEVIFICDK